MTFTRLRAFIQTATKIVTEFRDEEAIVPPLQQSFSDLLRVDDWLPSAYAEPDPVHYRQYLLHCDPLERFTVVSFVWGPGQTTPIHDHTVWGLVGVLRGAEVATAYKLAPDGRLLAGLPKRLAPGDIDLVSPRSTDVHQVANGFADRTSVSIHVYGGNIGKVRRHVFNDAGMREFVSGYSNMNLPNLWSLEG